MSETCEPHHDFWNTLLSVGLIVGLFASYIPQHFKIINKSSSEGFSPWFLLLGATSSAAGCLNMWTMQWAVVRCCRYIGAGSCLESLGGVIQVSLQFLLFAFIQFLYIIYYPQHLKYDVVTTDERNSRVSLLVKTNVNTTHWRTSVLLAWAVFLHFVFCTFITFTLLMTRKAPPSGPGADSPLAAWATFLGVTSAVLAAIQYYPQLLHTYRLRLVGALSIPMMVIQSPGAALMVVSIAMRPGTDWTSWIMFAVSGVMQAILLVICIAWKLRQRRLHIDDFGHPLPGNPLYDPSQAHSSEQGRLMDAPGASDDGEADNEAGVEGARAMEGPPMSDEELARAILTGENTPLLKGGKKGKTWQRVFRR